MSSLLINSNHEGQISEPDSAQITNHMHELRSQVQISNRE
uniref:Trafficking protein particle complex subunit 8 isoform X2 n=1 Tax=Rhizophora mucronata TaxID=61149 RepID=A0A2P2ML85_RHIMU